MAKIAKCKDGEAPLMAEVLAIEKVLKGGGKHISLASQRLQLIQLLKLIQIILMENLCPVTDDQTQKRGIRHC